MTTQQKRWKAEDNGKMSLQYCDSNCYSKALYSANISFTNEEEIKASKKISEDFPPVALQLLSEGHAPRVIGGRSKLGASEGEGMGTCPLSTGLKPESAPQKLAPPQCSAPPLAPAASVTNKPLRVLAA